jgi:iron-regulated transporter 1
LSGTVSIWFQNIFNLMALAVFLVSSKTSLIYLFLALIVISRLGLWSFDLVQVQVMQEYVNNANRGIVSGVEYSLTNLAYLILLGIGIVFNQPEDFGVIVLLSYVILLISSIIYTVWYKYKKPQHIPL